jgi:uncharacterized NAD(P)/FAD-binding protein YdhS
MSGVEGEPDHFVIWLKNNNFPYNANDFVPRFIYSLYLRDLVREASRIANEHSITFTFHHKNITDISTHNSLFCINENIYHNIILATGTKLRGQNNLHQLLSDKEFMSQEKIHILGSGLTAIDTLFTIVSREYKGKVIFHSRNGLLPHPHKQSNHKNNNQSTPINCEEFSLRSFIQQCRLSNTEWRNAVDSIRPYTQAIWSSQSIANKKRFLRHMATIWGVHRHRLSESHFIKLQSLQNAGVLEVTKDKIPPNVKFIDCTGIDFGYLTELDKAFIRSNIAKPDGLHLGLVSLHSNFHIIGSKNFGSLLETTAIPEIKTQAKNIANTILK